MTPKFCMCSGGFRQSVSGKKKSDGSLRESEIQKMILEYLSTREDVFVWRNQSTGIYDSMSGTWRKLRGVGRIQGVADILGIIGQLQIVDGENIGPGRFLAIEVKSRYGKPTPDQANFLEEVNNRGGVAFVAKSVQDVIFELSKIAN
jgi:hypothetical protein